MNDYREELWDLLEKYSETRLFRDWNDPRVNKELFNFSSDLMELHRKFIPPLYRIEKS